MARKSVNNPSHLLPLRRETTSVPRTPENFTQPFPRIYIIRQDPSNKGPINRSFLPHPTRETGQNTDLTPRANLDL